MQSEQEIPEQGTWIKLNDAAHLLGTSEITLRRRVKSGRIPYEFKNGKYYVFIKPGDAQQFKFSPPEITNHSEQLSPTMGHRSSTNLSHQNKINELEKCILDLRRQIADQQSLIDVLEEALQRYETQAH